MNRIHDMAVVTAFTGCLMGNFDDFQKYAESLMGRPIQTYEIPSLADSISEKARADFDALMERIPEEERRVLKDYNPCYSDREAFVEIGERWASESAHKEST